MYSTPWFWRVFSEIKRAHPKSLPEVFCISSCCKVGEFVKHPEGSPWQSPQIRFIRSDVNTTPGQGRGIKRNKLQVFVINKRKKWSSPAKGPPAPQTPQFIMYLHNTSPSRGLSADKCAIWCQISHYSPLCFRPRCRNHILEMGARCFWYPHQAR